MSACYVWPALPRFPLDSPSTSTPSSIIPRSQLQEDPDGHLLRILLPRSPQGPAGTLQRVRSAHSMSGGAPPQGCPTAEGVWSAQPAGVWGSPQIAGASWH